VPALLHEVSDGMHVAVTSVSPPYVLEFSLYSLVSAMSRPDGSVTVFSDW
jgi:hypothetical protein